MWEYWRDKKGIIEAIKEQYPHVLENDLRVNLIVMQIESHMAILNRLMQKIAGEEKENG